MIKLALIAVLVFVVSLVLISITGKQQLAKSAKEFGMGNAIRSAAFLSAAITVAIVLFLKYLVP